MKHERPIATITLAAKELFKGHFNSEIINFTYSVFIGCVIQFILTLTGFSDW